MAHRRGCPVRYPHTWTCTRSGAGSQDPDTGAWTPGADTTVYNGPADCQDEGTETSRDAEGKLVVRSVSTLFLEDEGAAPDHQEGDVGTVTWEDGTTDDAEVVRIRRLDGSMELRWL